MVERAFCELFIAGCLEVRHQRVNGAIQRSYRAVDGLDPSLLGWVERIVVRCLQSFTSYPDLLDAAAREVREARQLTLPGCQLHHPELEVGDLIDEALEYHPPACSCSV